MTILLYTIQWRWMGKATKTAFGMLLTISPASTTTCVKCGKRTVCVRKLIRTNRRVGHINRIWHTDTQTVSALSLWQPILPVHYESWRILLIVEIVELRSHSLTINTRRFLLHKFSVCSIQCLFMLDSLMCAQYINKRNILSIRLNQQTLDTTVVHTNTHPPGMFIF